MPLVTTGVVVQLSHGLTFRLIPFQLLVSQVLTSFPTNTIYAYTVILKANHVLFTDASLILSVFDESRICRI